MFLVLNVFSLNVTICCGVQPYVCLFILVSNFCALVAGCGLFLLAFGYPHPLHLLGVHVPV